MRITRDIAMPIVSQLMSLMDFNVNIMDENARIVASGDTERIGQQHEGALQVITSKQPLIIQEANSFYGSKPGVNLPIEFRNKIVGVVGITGDPAEVYRFGTIIKMNVEVLLQQIHMSQQSQNRKIALEGWIMDLITPNDRSDKRLKIMSQSLNINVDIKRVVLLVEIKELQWGDDTLNASLLQEVQECKERLLHEMKQLFSARTIYAYIENGTFFIAIPVPYGNDDEEMYLSKLAERLEQLGHHYIIGGGTAGKGIRGYKDSYKQAQQCIQLMKKFKVKQSIMTIEQWGIMPYLDAIPDEVQEAYIEHYLPVNLSLNDEYVRTLEVFLACNLDVKETSSRLHIHRNTLFYRLDKLSQQLNLDYRKYNDLVIMNMLFFFRRLQHKE